MHRKNDFSEMPRRLTALQTNLNKTIPIKKQQKILFSIGRSLKRTYQLVQLELNYTASHFSLHRRSLKSNLKVFSWTKMAQNDKIISSTGFKGCNVRIFPCLGLIIYNVRIRNCRVYVDLFSVQYVTVPVLFGSSFIDMLIEGIFLLSRHLFPQLRAGTGSDAFDADFYVLNW